jgi:hypothetical protein
LPSSALHVIALSLLIVGLVGNAPLWVFYFLRYAPVWPDDVQVNNPTVPHDAAAAEWIRLHTQPYERVLTSRMYAAALGGALTPLPIRTRYQAVVHGWDSGWYQRTAAAVDRALRDLNDDDLKELQIAWYLRCSADEVQLDSVGLERLRNPDLFQKMFELRSGSNFVEIYRYLKAPPST